MLHVRYIRVRLGAWQDNQIKPRRQLVLQEPKCFANTTLPACANHGVADFAGDDQTQSAVDQAIFARVNQEHLI